MASDRFKELTKPIRLEDTIAELDRRPVPIPTADEIPTPTS